MTGKWPLKPPTKASLVFFVLLSQSLVIFRSKLHHLTAERRLLAQRLCDRYAEALSEESGAGGVGGDPK